MNAQTINVSNKVTDLMRKSYGFSRQKYELVLKDTDTQLQIWRKIARYIYRNALVEQSSNPLETSEMEDLSFFLGFAQKTFGAHTLAKVDPKEFGTLEKRLFKNGFKDEAEGVKRAMDHAYIFTPNDNSGKGYRHVLYLLDPDNKVLPRYSNRMNGCFHWEKSNYKKESIGLLSRDRFNCLNLEDVRGLAQLFRAVIKQAKEQEMNAENSGLNGKFCNDPMKYLHSDAVHEDAVENMLQFTCDFTVKFGYNLPFRLACGDPKAFCKYTEFVNMDLMSSEEQNSLSNEWVVVGDAKNITYYGTYNKCLAEVFWPLQARNFLRKFIKKFVAQARMLKYQQVQSETEHAKFFQTKKNINLKTQAEMNRLSRSWVGLFSTVEIDNDVDLEDLQKLIPEFTSISDVLPRVNSNALPILRFRKIRNHKALGLFSPFNNTIAVDFRVNEKEGVGLQSFVHEYGHFLDYNGSNKGILSLQNSFSKILESARSEIYTDNKLTKKADYYSTSTEVFARAFELYCSHCGLNNSLIRDPEVYAEDSRFTTFSNECREWIYSYFKALFPDLEKNIKEKIEYEKTTNAQQIVVGMKKVQSITKEVEEMTMSTEKCVQLSLF